MQSRHIRGTGLFTEAFMAVTGPFMGSVNAVNSTAGAIHGADHVHVNSTLELAP